MYCIALKDLFFIVAILHTTIKRLERVNKLLI